MKLKIKDLMAWMNKVERSDHYVDFECGSPMAGYMDMGTNELLVDEGMVVDTNHLNMFIVDSDGERIPDEAMIEDLEEWKNGK